MRVVERARWEDAVVTDVRIVASAGLSPADHAALRRLWDAAFDDFSDDDAQHALGGLHAVVHDGDLVVAHAAVVPRRLLVGGRPFATGYLEAVATLPERRGEGLGSAVVRALEDPLRAGWQLGALSTGVPAFYERLGWERWRGPSHVVRDGALVRTPEEDDGLMVLRTGSSADLALHLPIACEDRPGDAW